ncbi:hypothetical protein [Haloarcula pellucida]|uniref:Uncharacterized protein n=1 Tax=Haloarcula pellucida TaxID=1427151 RepID=A0A830GSW7_9EURY|nr:hypothetical protein [Halomicroarcula pellucida]MBX0350498.1 hypothetical protein [Halomicroarcula pellucida]GGO03603.1 hypothetical protein GCM10009030_39440 [Halomicroarcula pellucida]
MNVSTDRFDLDQQDRDGIEAFEEYIWYNSEVCSHCFARVRDVGPEYSNVLRRTSGTELDVPDLEMTTNEWYERTDLGSQEYCPWDNTRRFGTCFCENCGSDTQPGHHQLPWEKMKAFAVNLHAYIRDHTPLSLSKRRFCTELSKLKVGRRDTQGKESQIFAVAFARALQTTPSTSADAAGGKTAALTE